MKYWSTILVLLMAASATAAADLIINRDWFPDKSDQDEQAIEDWKGTRGFKSAVVADVIAPAEQIASLRFNISGTRIRAPLTASADGVKILPGDVLPPEENPEDVLLRSIDFGGGPPVEVSLYRGVAGWTGYARTEEKLFEIRPLGDGRHLVVELDASELGPDDPLGLPEDDLSEGAADEAAPAAEGGAGDLPTAEPDDQAPPEGLVELLGNAVHPCPGEALSDITHVDVLIVYRSYMLNKISRTVGIDQHDAIRDMGCFQIKDSNDILSENGIDARLRMVDIYWVPDVTPAASKEFSSEKNALGYLQKQVDINSRRNMVKADIVVMLDKPGVYCGYAAFTPKDGARPMDSGKAHAVVDPNCLGQYSFLHEIAHLVGANHNLEKAAPGGWMPHAHGRHLGNRKYTLMAYSPGPTLCTPKCVRIRKFSSPITMEDGMPIGDEATYNNLRVLKENMPILAEYR